MASAHQLVRVHADADPRFQSQSIAQFWENYSASMRAENKAVCAKIAIAMEDDWSLATDGPADAMLGLWLHDVQDMIEAAGGKRGWALGVESQLTGQFKRMQKSAVPESARLVASESARLVASDADSTSGEHAASAGAGPLAVISNQMSVPKYSETLRKAGTLDKVAIPHARLDACLEETVNPQTTRIKRKEKSNILQEVNAWRVERASVGRDKDLTKLLARQLTARFPYIPGAPWKSSLKYLSGNRGRKEVEVRTRTCSRPHALASSIARARARRVATDRSRMDPLRRSSTQRSV
jgi:hypothetical protein